MGEVSLGYIIFYVDDVEASVRFLEEAFGLSTRFVTPENDYGEVDTGSTTLAFVSMELARSNLDAAGGFIAPDSSRPSASSITLITSDVEGSVARAVAAGGESYVDPVAKPWGQTVSYVLGPSNMLIEIASPVEA